MQAIGDLRLPYEAGEYELAPLAARMLPAEALRLQLHRGRNPNPPLHILLVQCDDNPTTVDEINFIEDLFGESVQRIPSRTGSSSTSPTHENDMSALQAKLQDGAFSVVHFAGSAYEGGIYMRGVQVCDPIILAILETYFHGAYIVFSCCYKGNPSGLCFESTQRISTLVAAMGFEGEVPMEVAAGLCKQIYLKVSEGEELATAWRAARNVLQCQAYTDAHPVIFPSCESLDRMEPLATEHEAPRSCLTHLLCGRCWRCPAIFTIVFVLVSLLTKLVIWKFICVHLGHAPPYGKFMYHDKCVDSLFTFEGPLVDCSASALWGIPQWLQYDVASPRDKFWSIKAATCIETSSVLAIRTELSEGGVCPKSDTDAYQVRLKSGHIQAVAGMYWLREKLVCNDQNLGSNSFGVFNMTRYVSLQNVTLVGHHVSLDAFRRTFPWAQEFPLGTNLFQGLCTGAGASEAWNGSFAANILTGHVFYYEGNWTLYNSAVMFRVLHPSAQMMPSCSGPSWYLKDTCHLSRCVAVSTLACSFQVTVEVLRQFNPGLPGPATGLCPWRQPGLPWIGGVVNVPFPTKQCPSAKDPTSFCSSPKAGTTSLTI